jgi:hypothetical protein
MRKGNSQPAFKGYDFMPTQISPYAIAYKSGGVIRYIPLLNSPEDTSQKYCPVRRNGSTKYLKQEHTITFYVSYRYYYQYQDYYTLNIVSIDTVLLDDISGLVPSVKLNIWKGWNATDADRLIEFPAYRTGQAIPFETIATSTYGQKSEYSLTAGYGINGSRIMFSSIKIPLYIGTQRVKVTYSIKVF